VARAARGRNGARSGKEPAGGAEGAGQTLDPPAGPGWATRETGCVGFPTVNIRTRRSTVVQPGSKIG